MRIWMIPACLIAFAVSMAPSMAFGQPSCTQMRSSFNIDAAQARLQALAWDSRQLTSSDGAEADCLFGVLLDGNAVRPSDWRSRYRLAIRLWDFHSAQALKAMPGAAEHLAEQMPPAGAIASPTPIPLAPIWRLDIPTGTLREQAMEAPAQFKLAFYFSPHCNPCRRATKAITESPRLRRMMAACGMWVAQIDHGTNVDDLRDWSRQQNGVAIWAIKDWASYGVPEPLSTPTFFAIRRGKVVGQLRGWPPEGNEAELLELIRANDTEHRCQ